LWKTKEKKREEMEKREGRKGEASLFVDCPPVFLSSFLSEASFSWYSDLVEVLLLLLPLPLLLPFVRRGSIRVSGHDLL
jgi:hypothetical protein